MNLKVQSTSTRLVKPNQAVKILSLEKPKRAVSIKPKGKKSFLMSTAEVAFVTSHGKQELEITGWIYDEALHLKRRASISVA